MDLQFQGTKDVDEDSHEDVEKLYVELKAKLHGQWTHGPITEKANRRTDYGKHCHQAWMDGIAKDNTETWHDLQLEIDITMKEIALKYGQSYSYCFSCPDDHRIHERGRQIVLRRCIKCESAKKLWLCKCQCFSDHPIMKENKVYIRKRKPMSLTVADLEKSMDEDDDEFKADVGPMERRIMPRQKSEKEIVLKSESEESESDSDDSVREKLEISETESEQDII